MSSKKENAALQGGVGSSSQLQPTKPFLSSQGSTMLSAALALAKRGKRVFPVEARGKKPLTLNGCKDASTDASIITRWWKRWPDANVGVATGAASGIFVLDIDGDVGEGSLRALERQHGALPPTVEAVTGGGGRHLFFSWPPQGGIGNSVSRLGQGLDVRGNGGYVVVPPSIHASGRRYTWSVDSCDQTVPAPAWLLSLVFMPSGAKSSIPVSEWRDIVKGVSEGQRNQTIARLAGILLRRWIDPYVAVELCLAWNETRCKPPLPYEEAIQTINNIAGRELARRRRQA